MFFGTNRKYIYSEFASYIVAIIAAAGSAWFCARFTKSDGVITVVSTICGSIGFIGTSIAVYVILHNGEYRRKERRRPDDIKNIFISNIHGLWATYLFRIPFQWIIQELGVSPPAAAGIAQTVAGQVGTVVRIYNNYRKNIFGRHIRAANVNEQEETVISSQQTGIVMEDNPKSKIKVLVCVHAGMRSHTVRAVAVGRALKDTGKYEVLCSGEGPFMKLAGQAGLECIQTELVSKERLYDEVAAGIANQYYKADNYRHFFAVEDALLRKYRPDIVIRDHFRDFAGVAAKQNDIRAFDVHIQKAPLSPYYHFKFKPEGLPDFFDYIPTKWLKPFRDILENRFRRLHAKYIHKKMKELNLGEEYFAIDGARPDLTLFPDAWEFFPFDDIDEQRCKYIGPMLLDETEQVPEWLEKFRADPRRKILITRGTTGEHETGDLFGQAFGDNKYAIAFHSLDCKKIAGFYGCEKFSVPAVLPYCDLLISHGGTGSTYLAASLAKPHLVLHDHFEQQINGWEINRLGIGRQLRKKRRSPQDVRIAAEEILNNPAYARNCLTVSQLLEKYDSINLAVKYIEAKQAIFKASINTGFSATGKL